MILFLRQPISLLIVLACIWSCRQATTMEPASQMPKEEKATLVVQHSLDYDTAQWRELTADMGFVIDIRYATVDNFVKEVIYPCGRCFLKKQAADPLIALNEELRTKGYAIKLFDCYRPAPAQQKLWDKVPDRNYVAPPWEGSMHTRGVAVDLTLTKKGGAELDMGTGYDFFGPEAHQGYAGLDPEAKANRALLKSSMEKAGFNAIRTEWWHYSIGDGKGRLYDWQWKCD